MAVELHTQREMIPLRYAQELTYQLIESQTYARLATVLASAPIFVTMYDGPERETVLTYWTHLFTMGFDPEDFYRGSLAGIEAAEHGYVLQALHYAADFFEIRGTLDFALELYSKLVAVAERRLAMKFLVTGHRGVGNIQVQRGDLAAALEHYAIARKLSEEQKDRIAVARIEMSIGSVHSQQGRYDEAVACYRNGIELGELLQDYTLTADGLGGVGGILCQRGEYIDAQNTHLREIDVAARTNNKRLLARAYSGLGTALSYLGENDAAIETFQKQLDIARTISDQRIMCYAIGNQAALYDLRGEHQKAIELYDQEISIAQSIGLKRRLSIGLGNKGAALIEMKRFEDAYPNITLALQMARSSEDLWAMTLSLSSLTSLLLEITIDNPSFLNCLSNFYPVPEGETMRSVLLKHAYEYAQECCEISERLSKRDTLLTSQTALAKIEWVQGQTDKAMQRLTAAISTANSEDELAGMYYQLWKITSSEIHRIEAIKYCEHMSSVAPHYYRNLLADLRGEPIEKD